MSPKNTDDGGRYRVVGVVMSRTADTFALGAAAAAEEEDDDEEEEAANEAGPLATDAYD